MQEIFYDFAKKNLKFDSYSKSSFILFNTSLILLLVKVDLILK